MATTENDLKIYYSGASELGEAQNLSIKSLGGYRSIVRVPNARFDNIFDEVGIYEANKGQEIYRCLFLKNEHATDAMLNLSLWIEGVQEFEKIEFGVSIPNFGEGETDLGTPQYGGGSFVQLLDSQYDMPYNVDFVEANEELEKVELFVELRAGRCIVLWLRRIIEENTLDRNKTSQLTLHFDWT